MKQKEEEEEEGEEESPLQQHLGKKLKIPSRTKYWPCISSYQHSIQKAAEQQDTLVKSMRQRLFNYQIFILSIYI